MISGPPDDCEKPTRRDLIGIEQIRGADGMLLLDKVFGKEKGVYYTVSDRSNGG